MSILQIPDKNQKCIAHAQKYVPIFMAAQKQQNSKMQTPYLIFRINAAIVGASSSILRL